MQGLRDSIRTAVGMTLLAFTATTAAKGDVRDSRNPGLEVRVWTADESDLASIEKEVIQLLQHDPNSVSAHHLLSHLQVRRFSKDPGDLMLLKQASDLAQQSIDLDPKSPLGYVALADILDLMGNTDRALKLLDDAESAGLEPNWRFYFSRARLSAEDAGAERSLKLLETALAFSDAERAIIVPYVIAIIQSGASGRPLIAKLDLWNQKFPHPLFTLTTAITYSELGQFDKAHELYASIIKDDPNSREALVNDAIILYRNLNNGKKAIAQLDTVLNDPHHSVNPSTSSTITAHLGAALLAEKSFKRAEDAFYRALAFDLDNTNVLDFVAKSYRSAKAHAEFVALLDRLNNYARGSGVVHALMAETLSEHLARHDDAIHAFQDAITLDPNRSDFYNGMGLAFYRKRNFIGALRLFNVATEVDPNDSTARYNAACVLSLTGQKDDAISQLAEALSLDPRLAASARSDRDFDGIKGLDQFRKLIEPGVDSTPLELPAH